MTGLPVVGHAQDGVVVGLDGSLAFPRLDVPVPNEEASARCYDLRPVRVQREGYLKAREQEREDRAREAKKWEARRKRQKEGRIESERGSNSRGRNARQKKETTYPALSKRRKDFQRYEQRTRQTPENTRDELRAQTSREIVQNSCC